MLRFRLLETPLLSSIDPGCQNDNDIKPDLACHVAILFHHSAMTRKANILPSWCPTKNLRTLLYSNSGAGFTVVVSDITRGTEKIQQLAYTTDWTVLQIGIYSGLAYSRL